MDVMFVETTAQEQRRDLCRWVERLVEEGHRVFVFVGSTVSAQQLDELLWSFSKTSFIPHRIVTDPNQSPTVPERVLIGWDLSARGLCTALVCDAPAALDAAASFDIVVHFVPMDDSAKREECRRLWVMAKERGHTVRHVPKETALNHANPKARRIPSP